MTRATGGSASAQLAQARREYLAFVIGEEEYGIEIGLVQELRGHDTLTAIANAPAYIKGVMNLRGLIVPVVDLRIPFGRAATYDTFTVVIVLNIRERVIGIVVDTVSDVVALSDAQIMPPPRGKSMCTECLSGVGTLGRRLVLLLDIEKYLWSGAIGLIDPVI